MQSAIHPTDYNAMVARTLDFNGNPLFIQGCRLFYKFNGV